MKFIKGTIITFSAQIICIFLGFTSSIVIARVLGPSGKGAYTLIVLISTLLASLGTLGIGVANLYFVGTRKYKLEDIASNSVIIASVLGSLLAALFLAYFHHYQLSFLKGTDPVCILLVTLILPFSLLTVYFSHILLGEQKIIYYNVIQIVLSASSMVFLLFLIIEPNVFGAILAWISATLATTIASIFLLRRLTSISISFNFQLFKESLKFGSQGFLGNIISLLNYRSGMFIINSFMNVTFVGYYSVAVTLAEALWYFPNAVGIITLARTPKLNSEEANDSTPRVCRNTIFITTLAAVLILIFGKMIINLFFGKSFLPALKPLWILLPGIVFLSISKVLDNELLGRGKPIIGTIGAGISLVTIIPLNLLLIPKWGIDGAAVASTIAYSLTAAWSLVAFMRISKNNLRDILIIKRNDFGIYMNIIISTKRFLASKFSHDV